MNKKKLKDIAHKEKEKEKRVITIQKYAIRMTTLAATIVATAVIFAQKLGNKKQKDIVGKMEDVKKDIKDEQEDITKDMRKTAKDIKKEINKHIK